jgi:hypothetical protein
MFVYRYVHTTQSPYLKLVANMRNYFLGYFVYILFLIVIIFVPGNMQLLYTNELKDSLRDIDLLAYSYLNSGYPSLALNVSF